MNKAQLIKALRALSEQQWGFLRAAEQAVGMPRNSLSGMLNGNRSFAERWQKKLIAYLHSIKNKAVVSEPVPPIVPVPSKKAAAAKPSPPAGMSKSKQIRWLRENSQTLR